MATKKGYLYSKKQPQESISILRPFIPERSQNIDLFKALEMSVPHFGKDITWGKLDENVIQSFLNWMYDSKLEKQQFNASDIMTNELHDSLNSPLTI